MHTASRLASRRLFPPALAYRSPFPRDAFLDTIVPSTNREGGSMNHPDLHISTQPPYFAGQPIGFSGWVDDFERSIAAIQFSLDGGEHWTEYATPGVSAERGVRWQFAFTPPRAGRYLLNVRARNGFGDVSDLVSGYPFEVFENPETVAGKNSKSRCGDPSALVHCVNGKDRTGVLCATALRIAGFSDKFIAADYLLANDVNAARIAEEEAQFGQGMTAEEHAILMSFPEARPSYLAAFSDEAEAQYGSFEGFVEKDLRLTPEQVACLRRLSG